MSTSPYWRPTKSATKSLPYQLKFPLQKKCSRDGNILSLLDDRKYLEALFDTNDDMDFQKGVQMLMDALEKHDEIEIVFE